MMSEMKVENAARRRGLGIVLVIFVLAAIGYAWHWYGNARYIEATEDAYVGGEIVPLSSEIPGTVTGIYARETQAVKAGDVIAKLDNADALLAVEAATSELARTVREVRASSSSIDEASAQIQAKGVELQRAQADSARREGMVESGALAAEELAHAREAVSAAELAIAALRQRRQALSAPIAGLSVATHPAVLRAATRMREAALLLARTNLRAPISGTVVRKNVQLGARINPGQVLLSIVPLDTVWVDANFKEVQLARIKPGMPVVLHSDFYGSSVEYAGSVVGISAGTGAAFALLPAQNASGNWIKVVQRVPVRIALERQAVAEHPLRIGLSMRARIDTRGSAAAVPSFVASERLPQAASDIDASIDALIEKNLR
jgi:membrane fusion protein, multidrug efflux system